MSCCCSILLDGEVFWLSGARDINVFEPVPYRRRVFGLALSAGTWHGLGGSGCIDCVGRSDLLWKHRFYPEVSAFPDQSSTIPVMDAPFFAGTEDMPDVFVLFLFRPVQSKMSTPLVRAVSWECSQLPS